jgi:hypothetical protein
MATATVTGSITYPVSVGGPNASMVMGSPVINPTSTTSATVTFNELSNNTYLIPLTTPTTIPFGTIASGNLVYIGTTQPITLTINGASPTFSLAAGGFVMLSGAAITALTAVSTLIASSVQVLILGD